MLILLLSCVHQTYNMNNVYYVHSILYLYPTSYHIMSLSYPDQ